MTTSTTKFQRRTELEIIRLLKEKDINKCDTAAFCTQHGISHQTFYNWQKKYGFHPSHAGDFIPLVPSASQDSDPIPFCEIVLSDKVTVRFFGTVDSKYLKSLIF